MHREASVFHGLFHDRNHLRPGGRTCVEPNSHPLSPEDRDILELLGFDRDAPVFGPNKQGEAEPPQKARQADALPPKSAKDS
jgi:hypothetical protein